jgi:hypothetical protein
MKERQGGGPPPSPSPATNIRHRKGTKRTARRWKKEKRKLTQICNSKEAALEI